MIAKRVFILMSGMGLSINGKHIYCGDYIFSGHTMVLTMGYLVIRECEWGLYDKLVTFSPTLQITYYSLIISFLYSLCTDFL